jgi:allantoinase
MPALVIRSRRVVFPDGVRPAALHIDEGRIVAVRDHEDVVNGVRLLDAGNMAVMPGVVDTHVHVNEPGRTEWEGFEHATRAAAAGGVTTLVDMPLNSIPATTSVAGFDAKQAAAARRCAVDVALWGGVVPGNADQLEPLADRGVVGFKCFLSPSGVDEFVHVSQHDLLDAAPILARRGLPLLVHAEDPARLLDADPAADAHLHSTWLATRPSEAEESAIDFLISLARRFGLHVHVVHLATAGAVPALRSARAEGVPITVETCPHYLTFCAEDIAPRATEYKCAPPIREHDNRERLWDALALRDIDLIATDHSPAPPAMKSGGDGSFLAAWGGIASLQLGLSAVWTGAAQRGFDLHHLARWLCRAPAALVGLPGKGTFSEGADADCVIWDPEAEWTVDPAALHHRHPVTPYARRVLRGRVRTTILRGQTIFDDGKVGAANVGQLLLGRTATIAPR